MAATRISAPELALWAAAIAAIAGLPTVVSMFSIVQLTVYLIFCILAVSLDLAWGLAGLLSFGQAAFFGIGGYAYGICGINGLPTLAASLSSRA